MVASKTIVSDVCGKENETVGMGVTTGELERRRIVGLRVNATGIYRDHRIKACSTNLMRLAYPSQGRQRQKYTEIIRVHINPNPGRRV